MCSTHINTWFNVFLSTPAYIFKCRVNTVHVKWLSGQWMSVLLQSFQTFPCQWTLVQESYWKQREDPFRADYSWLLEIVRSTSSSQAAALFFLSDDPVSGPEAWSLPQLGSHQFPDSVSNREPLLRPLRWLHIISRMKNEELELLPFSTNKFPPISLC